jgi:hypothetical protein
MRILPAVWFLTSLSTFSQAEAQQPSAPQSVVFIDVSVVPMTTKEVLPHQTVIVSGDRIAEIGHVSTVAVPRESLRIEGSHLYLMPGLVDAHVHLEPALGARPEFGDGPLFLAAGVTTVFNLRGSPEQLRWRDQLRAGAILGPNLYTSGEFINEPAETTPQEVEREVARQARDGYDLLKLHEIEDSNFRILTTTGLSRPAYDQLIASARQHNIPLVGHISTELGLKAALEDGQNLAHVVMYIVGYFVPIDTKLFRRSAFIGIAGLVLTLGWCFRSVTYSVLRWLRRKRKLPTIQRPTSPLRKYAFFYAAVVILLSGSYASLEWLGEDWRIYGITALAVICLLLEVLISIRCIASWKTNSSSWKERLQGGILLAGIAAYTISIFCFVPLSWRATSSGVENIARASKSAHIMVMTTLVVDHAQEMSAAPELKLLSKQARKDWGVDDDSIAETPGFLQSTMERHMQWFQEQIVRQLHLLGVPLLLGTDAFGFAGVPPGVSAHKELELLQESGLSPFEALRTATVNPATFLGRPGEFGQIIVGARADLLLVDSNPLQDLRTIRAPRGVMVRGRWFERRDLLRKIETLPD